MEPEPPQGLLIVETGIPGVLLGRVPVLLPEPQDVEIGITTTEDEPSWD